MSSDSREARLVLLAQSGDRQALDAMFRSIQRPLYRCLLGILGHEALAEDVLQEVFVLIYRKLKWLREPTLLRPWAYRIATRRALRTLKRERRWKDQERDPELLDAVPDPAAGVPANHELLNRLPGLIARVSPASRAVLVLHYREGLALKEVAQVLGVSLGTVKSRLAYGLATLRRYFGGRDAELE